MPTRTYQNIDFINYVSTEVVNNGTDLVTVNPFSNFHVTLSAAGNKAIAAPGTIQSTNNIIYNMSAQLDFDVFPAIPAGAQITKIEVQVDVEGNAVANATVTGLDDTNVDASGLIGVYTFIDSGELPDVRFQHAANDPAPGELEAEITVTGFDHYTATQTFDYSGVPITKGELITLFTNWLIQLQMNANATAVIGALSVSSGTTDETAGLTFTGIRVTITYTDGPVAIALTPSGGNVEKGQTITAEGPKADEQTYFAVIDNKVIPINPKIISPTEVLLEVPYPASDPCFDCFGDCPQCDDCFDACEADAESDACAECMQACLDCLTQCLENLQLAEECQQSTGTTGETTTTVVIYCGTQFGGSVELGSFNILVANGSGIYRFTMGKTNDTVYKADRDGTTYDVKIPNPGGTTGFFRS